MTRGRKRIELSDYQQQLIQELREGMDWDIVDVLICNGVPQSELARQLGMSQPWISRKLRHHKGAKWSEMDAAQYKAKS